MSYTLHHIDMLHVHYVSKRYNIANITYVHNAQLYVNGFKKAKWIEHVSCRRVTCLYEI